MCSINDANLTVIENFYFRTAEIFKILFENILVSEIGTFTEIIMKDKSKYKYLKHF